MEVTIDKLLQIIGGLHVELTMMRAEIERMKTEKQQEAKNIHPVPERGPKIVP